MAEVPMMTYLCRWCGAPYGLPTAMADNPAIVKRCALGHRHSDGRTVEDELRIAHEAGDRRCADIAKLRATVVSLKGQITKLKKAR